MSFSLRLCISLFAVILLAALISADSSKKNPNQLQIGVKFRPEGCKEGKVQKSKTGDQLKMHYRGTLTNGEQFDSSFDRDQPFEFKLGAGMVIKGWDRGLVDMCVGEKRKLTIPSDLGYGDRGAPPKIPGGATLIFEVELLEIL
eukprot:c11406_g1_i1.p1 GENE.c11406_g1_i1~~c11406_g1_i1.p1  ORF type:complete len:157 (+),score=47.99 c11406_g1_i1:40-471(+)